MKNKKMMSVAFVFLLSTMVPTYFVWANDDDEYEYEYEEHDREDDDSSNREEDDEHEYEYEYEEDDQQEYGEDDDSKYREEDDDQEYYEEDDSKYSEEVDKQKYEEKDDSDSPKPAIVQKYVNDQNVHKAMVPAITWDVWSKTVSTDYGPLPFTISKTVNIKNQDGKQMDCYVIPNQGQIMIPTVKTAELIGAKVKYYKTTKIAEIKLNGKELIIKSGSNAVYENDKKTPMPVEAMMYQDELYMPISVLTNGLGLTVTWDEEKQTFLIQQ